MRSFHKISEVSLDAIDKKFAEKIVSKGASFDPVFEAVCAIEYGENHGLPDDELFCSASVPNFWGDEKQAADWILHKRLRDRWWRAKKRAAEGKPIKAKEQHCSALDEQRKRCIRKAMYVAAQKSAGGNWSYQRRCVECFTKVKDKSKYRQVGVSVFR